jgi:hypothetical protein
MLALAPMDKVFAHCVEPLVLVLFGGRCLQKNKGRAFAAFVLVFLVLGVKHFGIAKYFPIVKVREACVVFVGEARVKMFHFGYPVLSASPALARPA